MENNKFKVESLITELELGTESLSVVLTDQENVMFNFEAADDTTKQACIINKYENGVTRNYIMIKILAEIRKNLEELNNTYMKMIRTEREVRSDKDKNKLRDTTGASQID